MWKRDRIGDKEIFLCSPEIMLIAFIDYLLIIFIEIPKKYK